MTAVAIVLSFIAGGLAVLLISSKFRPTGSPTDISAAVKNASSKAVEEATSKAKESLSASDADIVRRIDELRAKARDINR